MNENIVLLRPKRSVEYYHYSNASSQGALICETKNFPSNYNPERMGYSAEYSDRIASFDKERFEKACALARSGDQSWAYTLPKLSEAKLKEFAKVALDLQNTPEHVRIVHHFNVSNGYSCPVIEAIYSLIPIPSRIIEEPYIVSNMPRGTYMVPTDVGILPLKTVAKLVGLSRCKLYHRLFSSKNSRWDAANIFDKDTPRTVKNPLPKLSVCLLPETKRIYDTTNKIGKPGTWERRAYIMDRFRREQTLKNLPGMDQDYNSALRLNRMMAR